MLTPGYLDPQQWAAASTPDGWFRTGDQGYRRPDGHGIAITGRSKDLIIRKGENIAPEEIENELLAHPLVDEVAVLAAGRAARRDCAARWRAVRPATATRRSTNCAPSSTNAA